MNLINTFLERKSDWITGLFEHLQISLLSLIIAIFIAVPLGIIISGNKKTSEWFLQITGIFQTIPSLALLGLFIPFMGIGTLPAVVALVIYAIFPILQSTITGLSEIDSSLEEAATAFGMTKLEKLKKYQLALAMPILMGGVRTASIMIIGTATLAALIGAGGLGSFILLGIDRNNSALILIGAISSAVLAIVFGLIIKFLQDKKPKTILASLLAAVAALTISFFPIGKMSNDKLIIAGKIGAEPEALKGKSIDIYPEFTGTVTTTLLKTPETVPSNDPDEVYEVARKKIFEQDKLVYLKPTKFQDTYALAVTEDYAKANKINNISDIKLVENSAKVGFSLEFNDRKDGGIGLKNLYHLNLNVKTMEIALKYQAISNGDVNIIDVFSTDSKIITNKLKLLNDDRRLFPPYQGAPILREETLKKHPELEKILNKLAGKITEKEMTEMNYKVDVEGKSSYDVAKEYLQKEGLIKK